MPDKTSRIGRRGGDFLIHIESEQRNLNSVQLTMPAGGPFSYSKLTGLPLDVNNVPIVVGGEAAVTKVVIWGPAFSNVAGAANTTSIPQYTVIDEYTGAVLNETALVDTDLAGASYNKTALGVALTALGAKVVREPIKTDIQVN